MFPLSVNSLNPTFQKLWHKVTLFFLRNCSFSFWTGEDISQSWQSGSSFPGWWHNCVVCSFCLPFLFSTSKICSILLILEFEFQDIRNLGGAKSRVTTEIKTMRVAIKHLDGFIPTICKCIKFRYLSNSKWSTHISFLFESCYSQKCYVKGKS